MSELVKRQTLLIYSSQSPEVTDILHCQAAMHIVKMLQIWLIETEGKMGLMITLIKLPQLITLLNHLS